MAQFNFKHGTSAVTDIYQKNSVLFLKFICILVVIGLFERCVFAVYHQHLTQHFSTGELITTLLWGVRFDLALSGFFGLITLLLSYLLQRVAHINSHLSVKYLCMLFASITFMLQGADILYFTDSARHLGYEITDTFTDATQLLSTAWTVYKLPLLFHVLLYPVVIYSIARVFHNAPEKNKNTFLRGAKNLHVEASYLLLLVISVVLARGGMQSVPLEPLHAQEISDSTKATLALNGAYNAIFYLFNKDIVKPVTINHSASLDVKTIFDSLYPDRDSAFTDKSTWQPNIIFILLESWPAMYMQSYGYDRSTTPFFDQLRSKSLTSREMIAGGHRTTEGMFSSFCSAQNPLGQTIAQSQLQDHRYRCLPHILREQGYQTSFFQGTNKNTSGTGAFAQLLGFSNSYGKADIKERKYPENDWGVYDQDLYDYVYQSLRQSKSPVLYGINTNTTHDIALPSDVKPAFPNISGTPEKLNTLHFADQALQEFFYKVENDPELGDTLWVMVADHTAGLRTSRLNNYRIPFLVYHRNKLRPQMVERVASQRDIAPSILALLQQEIPTSFSGKAIQQHDKGPYFADYYHSGILGWIEEDLLLEIPLADTESTGCYQHLSDKIQSNKLACPESAKKVKDRALAFSITMQSLLFNDKLTSATHKAP